MKFLKMAIFLGVFLIGNHLYSMKRTREQPYRIEMKRGKDPYPFNLSPEGEVRVRFSNNKRSYTKMVPVNFLEIMMQDGSCEIQGKSYHMVVYLPEKEEDQELFRTAASAVCKKYTDQLPYND